MAKRDQTGTNNPNSSLSDHQIKLILLDHRPYRVLSKKWGVSLGMISYVKRGMRRATTAPELVRKTK